MTRVVKTMKKPSKKLIRVGMIFAVGLPLVAAAQIPPAVTVSGVLAVVGGGIWGRFQTSRPIVGDPFSVRVRPTGPATVTSCFLMIDAYKLTIPNWSGGISACSDAIGPILAGASSEVLKCVTTGTDVSVDYDKQSSDCP